MRWIFFIVLTVLLGSCGKEEKITTVDYHFVAFYFGKIYLEKVPVNDEELKVIDSAEIDYKTEHLSFKIPAMEESVFQLRIAGKPLRIFFINDADKIVIHGSAVDPKDYTFENKGINTHLKAFIDRQKKINDQVSSVLAQANKTLSSQEQAHLMKQADSLKVNFEKNARSFADTTSSAGAFLFTYNMVDFGKDRKGLKEFITKAASRFPAHKNIQVLKDETLGYISIYEEELNIGDPMPQLFLPDTTGITLSGLVPQGKYAFIDLWSTWCTPCMAYIPAKKEAANKFPADKFALVSIAIDAEKEMWKKILQQYHLPGSHYIDEKMWRGKTARTWKFDSIPFNYLLSPEGKILAKAIRQDSLMLVLTKFVK